MQESMAGAGARDGRVRDRDSCCLPQTPINPAVISFSETERLEPVFFLFFFGANEWVLMGLKFFCPRKCARGLLGGMALRPTETLGVKVGYSWLFVSVFAKKISCHFAVNKLLLQL
jgi:hypothetical protein